MTCSNSNPNFVQFRRVLRLTLSVSLLSGSVLASNNLLCGDAGALVGDSPTMIDLPQYPSEINQFAIQTETGKEPRASSSSRMVLVQRWLGLGQRIGSGSSTRAAEPGYVEHSFDSNTSLPIEPPLTLPAPAPSSNTMSLVVTASATQDSESVVESFSDEQDGTVSLSESVDPVDLMNSLELDSSVGADVDETSTSLSLSDRVATASGDRTSLTQLEPSQSRKPQIVGTHQPLLLRSARPAKTISSPAEQIGSQDQTVTSSVQNADLLNRESAQHSKTSSRRGFRPEPMKIQILGQQKQVARSTNQKPQREPLVAMLANYPLESKSKPAEKQNETLKEMIQSEREASIQRFSDSSEPVDLPKDEPTIIRSTTESASERDEPTSNLDAKVVDTDQHFDLRVRDSLHLKCENTIHGVSIEMEDICQVIQTGSHNYTLIGLNEGVTRFALITEVSGERQIEIHEATVNSRSGGPDLESLADSMDRTIRQLYPTSRVTVEAIDQRIMVRGKVDSEESARKIIGLIRKTALAPVVDQLTTY